MSNKNFKIEKVEKLENSEARITGEISLELINETSKEAAKKLNNSISLPGFRPGNIPNDVLTKTVGEMRILEEAAEIALAQEYGNIVIESKLLPFTRPKISITKLAPNIPLSFTIEIMVEPEFKLPDYKKIASEVKEEDKDKRRIKIVENITEESKIKLPEKFIESEVDHTLSHFKQDVKKAGMEWEEYLSKVNGTEEKIRETWKEQITKRTSMDLVLSKIAEKEKLKTYKELLDLLDPEKEKTN